MRLQLVDIEKRFGGVTALARASLDADSGEIVGLCGENGAGKSTLLKVLSGVHPHKSYRGEVRVDGETLALRSTADARARGIAIVHQELMLVPELSVADNLFLGREPTRLGVVDDARIERDARQLLSRFGVDREIDAREPVGTLGIGLQQLVEIVRALAEDAHILVLDEPTAALTGGETERLLTWLRGLKQRGTTCLYVSHRMDEIFVLTDRITVLRDGRTAGTVVTAETTPDAVVELMVGRSLVVGHRAPPPTAEPTADKACALEARELRLGGVLENISLSVHAGEIVAVAGAMGSGRTALLSTLFGCATAPVAGEVRIDGQPVRLRSPREAIAAGLSLVPEDRRGRGLVPLLSVAENLALPSHARGALFGFVDDLDDARVAQKRIGELRVRGAADADAEVNTLSGGNQQKVVFGKWLAHPPKVLLLDEPTRGVDVGAREEIYELLRALTRRGTAVLLASSDLAEVLRLADRILVLRHGRIAGELDGETASEAKIVALSTGAGLIDQGDLCA